LNKWSLLISLPSFCPLIKKFSHQGMFISHFCSDWNLLWSKEEKISDFSLYLWENLKADINFNEKISKNCVFSKFGFENWSNFDAIYWSQIDWHIYLLFRTVHSYENFYRIINCKGNICIKSTSISKIDYGRIKHMLNIQCNLLILQIQVQFVSHRYCIYKILLSHFL